MNEVGVACSWLLGVKHGHSSISKPCKHSVSVVPAQPHSDSVHNTNTQGGVHMCVLVGITVSPHNPPLTTCHRVFT